MNSKYARVMHHIGGLSGKNDNSEMIQGGEDVLNLIEQDDIPAETDVKRLAELGAIRPATEDEVEKWEVAKGLREAAPDSRLFADYTTGNEPLHPEMGQQGGAVGASPSHSGAPGSANTVVTAPGGDAPSNVQPSGGHMTYQGKTKGELSEENVPTLRDMAKEEGIEGYASMLKEPLLDALLALGK